MAGSKMYASPLTSTFGSFDNMRESFVVKVSIPKGAVSDKPLPSPLRAMAPAFAPVTTSAPEIPPGLTPRKAVKTAFSIESLSGLKAFGRYLIGLESGKVFVPEAPEHPVTGGTGVSSTPSAANAVNAPSPMSAQDKETLDNIISRKTVAQLLHRYDPSHQLIAGRPTSSYFAVPNKAKRAIVHEIIERVWAGRLSHETDSKTNTMWFAKKHNYVPKALHDGVQGNPRNNTAAVNKPTRAAEHSAWGAFAVGEDVKHAEARAKTAAEAANAEKFALSRKQNEEAWQARQEARKNEPQPVFKQVFKLTGNTTTNGKLGGPRKQIDTLEAKDTSETAPNAIQDGGVPLAASEEVVADKPKRATLPPHLRKKTTETSPAVDAATAVTAVPELRKRSVSPPHLRKKSTETASAVDGGATAAEMPAAQSTEAAGTTDDVATTGEKRAEPTETAVMVEWVAARLPNISI